MKTLIRSLTMVSFYVMLTGLLSSSICEGEESIDCNVLATKYAAKATEIANSISTGGQIDCSDLDDLYNEFFDLLRKGKDCPAIQTGLQALYTATGASSVDDLISFYEDILVDIGC